MSLIVRYAVVESKMSLIVRYAVVESKMSLIVRYRSGRKKGEFDYSLQYYNHCL